MPQDRLAGAVECLAVSAESIQQRLAKAGLELVPLHPDEFADDDRQEYETLMAALSAVEPAGSESAIEATTRRLSDQDAVELARKIVALDAVYRPLG